MVFQPEWSYVSDTAKEQTDWKFDISEPQGMKDKTGKIRMSFQRDMFAVCMHSTHGTKY